MMSDIRGVQSGWVISGVCRVDDEWYQGCAEWMMRAIRGMQSGWWVISGVCRVDVWYQGCAEWMCGIRGVQSGWCVVSGVCRVDDVWYQGCAEWMMSDIRGVQSGLWVISNVQVVFESPSMWPSSKCVNGSSFIAIIKWLAYISNELFLETSAQLSFGW